MHSGRFNSPFLPRLGETFCIKFITFALFCVGSSDSQKELELVQRLSRETGAYDSAICTHWSQGGAGTVDLAAAVVKACDQPSNFKCLYDLEVQYLLF